MKNLINFFLFFTLLLTFQVHSNEKSYLKKINVDNKELKCYYNYNNDNEEFAVVRQSNMYYFYAGNEEWFFISRKNIKYREHKGIKYYIGNLQDQALEFSERYSICF